MANNGKQGGASFLARNKTFVDGVFQAACLIITFKVLKVVCDKIDL